MTLRVKVIPRSPRSEIVGELADGTLKVRIAAAPERGKANEALIELLRRSTECNVETSKSSAAMRRD